MIAIISDIHGNYPALSAVLDDINSVACERIISLGDVAGYYCMLNECIYSLRERGIVNIMGNHDKYIVSRTLCPRSNAANRCLDYQQRIITDANRSWLEKSPSRLDFDEISMVHGGWYDPLDEYIQSNKNDYFSRFPGRFFFSGHTHVQVLFENSGKIYCNPGSVGQPRDGKPEAAYALWDNGIISLKRVEYDIDSIAISMKKEGFDAYFYQNLYTGSRIGGGITHLNMDNMQ